MVGVYLKEDGPHKLMIVQLEWWAHRIHYFVPFLYTFEISHKKKKKLLTFKRSLFILHEANWIMYVKTALTIALEKKSYTVSKPH